MRADGALGLELVPKDAKVIGRLHDGRLTQSSKELEKLSGHIEGLLQSTRSVSWHNEYARQRDSRGRMLGL